MIRGADLLVQLEHLGHLLKITKIPDGHDLIIAAWNDRWRVVVGHQDSTGVVDFLKAQKSEAQLNGAWSFSDVRDKSVELSGLIAEQGTDGSEWEDRVVECAEKLASALKAMVRALHKEKPSL